jgi:hypothetical protein
VPEPSKNFKEVTIDATTAIATPANCQGDATKGNVLSAKTVVDAQPIRKRKTVTASSSRPSHGVSHRDPASPSAMAMQLPTLQTICSVRTNTAQSSDVPSAGMKP